MKTREFYRKIFLFIFIIILVVFAHISVHYNDINKLTEIKVPVLQFNDENVEKIEIGMIKKKVKEIFGHPDQISVYINNDVKLEKWIYKNDEKVNEFTFHNDKLYSCDVSVWGDIDR